MKVPVLEVMIVEDEAPARERLRRLLERVGQCEVVAEASNGADALRLLEVRQPDVLLLDINMPGIDGLRLAEALDDPPLIVFTTAYEHHALRAFELEAIDYLLKPFSAERLAKALDRARRMLERAVGAEGSSPSRIAAEDGRDTVYLDAEALALARIEEGVVFLFLRAGERLIFAGSLQQLQALLPGRGFLQASRQSIVNVDAIRRSTTLGDGRLLLELDGGAREEVSRRRARFFRSALGE